MSSFGIRILKGETEKNIMTNKEKILSELKNNVERLAKLLIDCKDITGWDEIPTYRYTTSDGTTFDSNTCYNAEKEALDYEIEWLKANA